MTIGTEWPHHSSTRVASPFTFWRDTRSLFVKHGGRASREEGERSHGACSEAGGARGVCSYGVGWGWLSDLCRSAIDRHRGGSSQRRHARRE